ncbi:MAG: tRNA-dihydrouridine synthase [Myxococcales bacterium]|nr:tRNA-dihydrouridine synthase [Myxococcales bacterium]
MAPGRGDADQAGADATAQAPTFRALAPLRVGRISVSPPVVQAPMSAITNLPMRTLTEEQGCGLTITEFLPAAGIAARHAGTLSRVTPSKRSRAFGVQIYGRDADQMQRAAAVVVDMGAALVDINMGCPGKKVTSGACGAALMRDPPLAESIVRAVVRGVDGAAEVSVKMRAGWDDKRLNAPELAERLVGAGAQMITVHGRTRDQRYAGEVDLDIIARVKARLGRDVPVLANGDITGRASLERALAHTGCDGAMIGRAALGNPWLFFDFAELYAGRARPEAPTRRARVEMYGRHLALYLEQSDPQRAIIEMRKFAPWYLESLDDGEALCRHIYRTRELAPLRALLARAAAGECFGTLQADAA